ncbi:MAG: type II secretion system protein [Phycisphaerales bacterium]
MTRRQAHIPFVRRAFSLLEVMAVVIVLAILAAVAIPQFVGVSDEARTSSLQSTLSGVRSSIASFRSTAVINGSDPYPTLAQLTTSGAVLKFDLPTNPFTNVSGVQSVDATQAAARAVVSADSYGWNYYVDNTADPPTAVFYANTDTPTTAPDGSGGVVTANDL